MNKRALAFTIVGVVFFVAYLVWSNPLEAFAEVGAFNVPIYLVAVAIDFLGLMFWATSWYLILRAMKVEIGLWTTTQLSFTSLFIGWIAPLPLMTEMVRAYLIKDRSTSNLGKGLSSVLVHRAYYNIAFGLIIGGTTFITLLSGGQIPINPAVSWFLTVFALVSVAIFILTLNRRALTYVYSKSPQFVRRKVFDRYHNSETGENGFNHVIDDIADAICALKAEMGLNLTAFAMLVFHWSAGVVDHIPLRHGPRRPARHLYGNIRFRLRRVPTADKLLHTQRDRYTRRWARGSSRPRRDSPFDGSRDKSSHATRHILARDSPLHTYSLPLRLQGVSC